ncbi:MAG: phosphatase PAP2 family protein, partial [Pseudobdellovibrionaceae bacterium]
MAQRSAQQRKLITTKNRDADRDKKSTAIFENTGSSCYFQKVSKLLKQTIQILALVIPACVILILYFDQSISLYFNGPELESFRGSAKILTDAGLGAPYFILALIGYSLGRWVLKNSKLREFSAFSFFALAAVGFVLHILKLSIGRQRPYMTETYESQVFSPFRMDWNSFPSGHSQVVFTVATLAALVFPKWRVLYFILALALAFTRVITHQHFMSDILMGATVGFLGT